MLNAQFNWYMRLAQEADTKRRETGLIGDPFVGLKYASDWLIKEMEWYTKALKIKPTDLTAQEAFRFGYNLGLRLKISWGSEINSVRYAIEKQDAEKLEDIKRRTANRDMQVLMEKLKNKQNELAVLKQKKGLLTKFDIEDCQDDIRKLSAEINKLRAIVGDWKEYEH